MATTGKFNITLSSTASVPGSSFSTDTSIENVSTRSSLNVQMASADTTATIPIHAKGGSAIKYIGVSTDQALTGVTFKDSGSSALITLGSMTASQGKQSGGVDGSGADIDFDLPSSGNDIAEVTITKSAGSDTVINIEIYFNEVS